MIKLILAALILTGCQTLPYRPVVQEIPPKYTLVAKDSTGMVITIIMENEDEYLLVKRDLSKIMLKKN